MSLWCIRTTGALVLIAAVAVLPARAQEAPAAIKPTEVVKLFDGKSLANFETWLVDHHSSDPERVFTRSRPDRRRAGDPRQRPGLGRAHHEGGVPRLPSGRRVPLGRLDMGRPKDARARQRHAAPRAGTYRQHRQGLQRPWLRSIEFQIIEGGVGDILPVLGYGDDGTAIRPAVKATTRKDRDGETVYDAKGTQGMFSARPHQLVGPQRGLGGPSGFPRRAGRREPGLRVDAHRGGRRWREADVLRERQDRERRVRFDVQRRPDHDSVGRRGDLLPSDRASTAEIM